MVGSSALIVTLCHYMKTSNI